MATGTPKPSVGWVGLGAMGFGMATHLIKQGFVVKGFDVFPKTLERFKEAGGIPASSLADSAWDSPYYVCMVASAQQLQDLLFEGEESLVHALPQNVTFLACSTVPATYIQSVEAQFRAAGRHDVLLVDCPVSGGAKRAADGTLSIMAGGSVAALESGKLLLSTMADVHKLYVVSGGIGAGSNMKMVHQVLAGIHILAASEAMGFAARLGLDLVQVQEVVNQSPGHSWMLENRIPKMLEKDFVPPASALTIILKDVGIITAAARHHSFPTPLVSTAEQVYLSGITNGIGAEDDSGMIRMYCEDFSAPETYSSRTRDQNSPPSPQIISKLLQCIHLVAAAEAIAFASHLKVDLAQFYSLVVDAAGASWTFKNFGAQMIGPQHDVPAMNNDRISDIIKDLSSIVQRARDLTCPLYLAVTALNILLVVERKGLGAEGLESVIKYYEGNSA